MFEWGWFLTTMGQILVASIVVIIIIALIMGLVQQIKKGSK